MARLELARTFLMGLLLAGVALPAHAQEPLKREETFAFATPPSVKIDGDNVAVSFAVTAACDATVAVEDAHGEILRHLASGVLGRNAPAPFQKDSLSQTVVWDGKDDLGHYVDNRANARVRVSLGLKARFERTLFWSPHKRIRTIRYMNIPIVMAAAPEGVYWYEGGAGDHIRLFGHDGAYVKTVWPPPAAQIEKVEGLVWKSFPQDGRKLPLKGGQPLSDLLTTGVAGEVGTWNIRQGGGADGMAVQGTWIYLTGQRLNRLCTDGSTGGQPLSGPELWHSVKLGQMHEYPGGTEQLPPESIAVSPDGKWLYTTGFTFVRSWHEGGLNGVAKVAADAPANGKGEIFAGHLNQGNPGKKDGEFDVASCVAVDPQGRVYVGDYLNQRVQVFTPEGKFVKAFPAPFPAQIQINPKNGEIHVFSWILPASRDEKVRRQVKPLYTRFGPLDDPKKLTSCPLDIVDGLQNGTGTRAVVDFWAEQPTIWLCESGSTAPWIAPDPKRANVKLFVEQGGKLKQIRDFNQDAGKEVVFTRPTRHMKQRLYFDHKNGRLLVGELWEPSQIHCTSMADAARIDPESGRTEWIKLPFDCEDMAFDMRGMAYLRTQDKLARFDARTWREVPFDYGDEQDELSTWGVARAKVMAALSFAGDFESSSQLGGLAVSPKGSVAVTVFNATGLPNLRNAAVEKKGGATVQYTPRIYPGRSRPWEIHVWDQHGKLLYEDAIAGIGRPVGIALDERNDLYLMQAGQGYLNGELYYNPVSCTYVKARPLSKFLATQATIPLGDSAPKVQPEVKGADFAGDIWTQGAYWARGGVAIDGKRNKCHCASQSRPALDYYARSFLPEVDRYSVLVLDTNGNEILRLGRYGNIDDGMPLVQDGGPAAPRSIGGDEVAIMHNQMLAVQSDRRLFVGDLGNARVACVKLDYHASETVKLSGK